MKEKLNIYGQNKSLIIILLLFKTVTVVQGQSINFYFNVEKDIFYEKNSWEYETKVANMQSSINYLVFGFDFRNDTISIYINDTLQKSNVILNTNYSTELTGIDFSLNSKRKNNVKIVFKNWGEIEFYYNPHYQYLFINKILLEGDKQLHLKYTNNPIRRY